MSRDDQPRWRVLFKRSHGESWILHSVEPTELLALYERRYLLGWARRDGWRRWHLSSSAATFALSDLLALV